MVSCENFNDKSLEIGTLIYNILKGIKVFQGVLFDIVYYISLVSYQVEFKNQP